MEKNNGLPDFDSVYDSQGLCLKNDIPFNINSWRKKEPKAGFVLSVTI